MINLTELSLSQGPKPKITYWVNSFDWQSLEARALLALQDKGFTDKLRAKAQAKAKAQDEKALANFKLGLAILAQARKPLEAPRPKPQGPRPLAKLAQAEKILRAWRITQGLGASKGQQGQHSINETLEAWAKLAPYIPSISTKGLGPKEAKELSEYKVKQAKLAQRKEAKAKASKGKDYRLDYLEVWAKEAPIIGSHISSCLALEPIKALRNIALPHAKLPSLKFYDIQTMSWIDRKDILAQTGRDETIIRTLVTSYLAWLPEEQAIQQIDVFSYTGLYCMRVYSKQRAFMEQGPASPWQAPKPKEAKAPKAKVILRKGQGPKAPKAKASKEGPKALDKLAQAKASLRASMKAKAQARASKAKEAKEAKASQALAKAQANDEAQALALILGRASIKQGQAKAKRASIRQAVLKALAYRKAKQGPK